MATRDEAWNAVYEKAKSEGKSSLDAALAASNEFPPEGYEKGKVTPQPHTIGDRYVDLAERALGVDKAAEFLQNLEPVLVPGNIYGGSYCAKTRESIMIPVPPSRHSGFDPDDWRERSGKSWYLGPYPTYSYRDY